MFEKAAIFSAVLLLIIFGIAGIKFLKLTGLEKESAVEVIKEIFPPIEMSEN